MPKLLIVEASPRGEYSISRNLAAKFVADWKTAHRDRDIATTYLRLVLKVIGIEDVTFVAAGGSKVVDMGQQSREDFLAPFGPALSSAAQT